MPRTPRSTPDLAPLRRSTTPNLDPDVGVTSSTTVMESGRERLRVGPWRGDPVVAYLNPVPGAPLPSADFVRRCLRTLERQGYGRVVTGALSPSEQSAFRAAGFAVTEHLHLLSHDLRAIPAVEAPENVLRRSSRSSRNILLRVCRTRR